MLGGRDSIVDVDAVARYVRGSPGGPGQLERGEDAELGVPQEPWTGMELIYLADLEHGQTILGPEGMRVLHEVVRMHSSMERVGS